MEYRTLGRTGIHVSRLCLGTMTFGDQVNEHDAHIIVDMALEAGINFFDTANVYADGQSEIITGKAIKKVRNSVILTSKCGGTMSPDVNGKGLSRQTIIHHVNDSLKRLDTDYLDVLFLHFPDADTASEDYIETVSFLMQQGKVLHYGISNFPAWKCCSIIHQAREMGLPEPVVSENVYNMITRGLDDEMLPFLSEYKLGLVTYNPLAGGMLTGKHSHGKLAEGTRLATNAGYAARYATEANQRAVATILNIAQNEGVSPIDLAYQWLMNKPYIDSIICGVSKIDHFDSNLSSCLTVKISDAALNECDKIWNSLKGTFFNYHY